MIVPDLLQVVSGALADDDRAAGCRQHAVSDDLKSTVFAAAQHGQGEGVEFIDEFFIGITVQITCRSLDRHEMDQVMVLTHLLLPPAGQVVLTAVAQIPSQQIIERHGELIADDLQHFQTGFRPFLLISPQQ